MYFSVWLPEVTELLEIQDALAERLVWLFSDGPTDELKLSGAWRAPERLSPLLAVIGPQDVALFGGRVVGDALSLDDWLVNPALRGADVDERDWGLSKGGPKGLPKHYTNSRPGCRTVERTHYDHIPQLKGESHES